MDWWMNPLPQIGLYAARVPFRSNRNLTPRQQNKVSLSNWCPSVRILILPWWHWLLGTKRSGNTHNQICGGVFHSMIPSLPRALNTTPPPLFTHSEIFYAEGRLTVKGLYNLLSVSPYRKKSPAERKGNGQWTGIVWHILVSITTQKSLLSCARPAPPEKKKNGKKENKNTINNKRNQHRKKEQKKERRWIKKKMPNPAEKERALPNRARFPCLPTRSLAPPLPLPPSLNQGN